MDGSYIARVEDAPPSAGPARGKVVTERWAVLRPTARDPNHFPSVRQPP
jgi:hypothetical protein